MHFRYLLILTVALLVACRKSAPTEQASSAPVTPVQELDSLLDSISIDTVAMAGSGLSIYTDQVIAALQHRYRRVGADAFFNYLKRMTEKGFSLADGCSAVDPKTSPLNVYQIIGLQTGPLSPRYYGSLDLRMYDLQGAVCEATVRRYVCDSVVDNKPFYSDLVHTDSVQFNRSGTQVNMRQHLGLLNLQDMERDRQGRITHISDNTGNAYYFFFRQDGNLQNSKTTCQTGGVVYSSFKYNRQGDQIERNQIVFDEHNSIRKSYFRIQTRDSYGNWTERLCRELIDYQHSDVVDTLLYMEKRTIVYY